MVCVLSEIPSYGYNKRETLDKKSTEPIPIVSMHERLIQLEERNKKLQENIGYLENIISTRRDLSQQWNTSDIVDLTLITSVVVLVIVVGKLIVS